VDNAQTIGIRPLAPRSDVPKLLGKLMMTAELTRDWKQRANDK